MANLQAILAHFGSIEDVTSLPFASESEALTYLSKVRASIDASAIMLNSAKGRFFAHVVYYRLTR